LLKSNKKLINPKKPKITLIIVNKSVLTQKKTQPITIAKINWILLFKELIAVDSESYETDEYTLCAK
jgi:hypothetical protein